MSKLVRNLVCFSFSFKCISTQQIKSIHCTILLLPVDKTVCVKTFLNICYNSTNESYEFQLAKKPCFTLFDY